MYAKGHEEDEKLHKAFHQAAVQGPRFQVWWDNVCNLTSNPPAQSTMPDDAVVCTNAAPLRLAIIHTRFCSAIVLQGWSQERVLLSEPFAGRLLMVLLSDPSNHIKRVSSVQQQHPSSYQQCMRFFDISIQRLQDKWQGLQSTAASDAIPANAIRSQQQQFGNAGHGCVIFICCCCLQLKGLGRCSLSVAFRNWCLCWQAEHVAVALGC